jgi:hypothetical protein
MPVNKVFKTRMRWERAARMEAVGCSDADIALAIGISLPGLATLKQSDEYRQIRLQISTGILSEIDSDIADATGELRDRLKEQVPVALQAIADLVAQRTDPKLRLQAAESILDRDGRFMKASRTVVNDQSDLPAYMSDKDADTVNRIIATQQPVVPVVVKTKDGETIQ